MTYRDNHKELCKKQAKVRKLIEAIKHDEEEKAKIVNMFDEDKIRLARPAARPMVVGKALDKWKSRQEVAMTYLAKRILTEDTARSNLLVLNLEYDVIKPDAPFTIQKYFTHPLDDVQSVCFCGAEKYQSEGCICLTPIHAEHMAAIEKPLSSFQKLYYPELDKQFRPPAFVCVLNCKGLLRIVFLSDLETDEDWVEVASEADSDDESVEDKDTNTAPEDGDRDEVKAPEEVWNDQPDAIMRSINQGVFQDVY